ncbi:receptor-interacting serine/threonine-protein kinase 1 isoform X2 [Narcine bancroftii]|uniref:receptor-interacting serine/threonine-protein kinase 1 isoform X2 n=1 Tax=Narcine bancroftii TaxID=1343680 RepID=UPI0038314ED6
MPQEKSWTRCFKNSIYRTTAYGVTIPLPVKGRIILEIIDGMTYLHIMNIVHKDLKPENILVDADYHIKIADLGVSIFRTWSRLTTEELKRRCQMSSKPQNNAGTLAYLAPEHLQSLNAKATEKSDVYSFAIVMWVILTNREPYENALNNTQVMNLVIKGERPDLSLIPDEPPEKMVSLMQGCWANEPEKRPTFAECNEEFQPFYKKNLQKYIDESVETLRKLSQNRPTASRELMKRMKSLQVDCVGIMPDIPPKDDPKSLHSSQGISVNDNSLGEAFSSCQVSEPSEYEVDSSACYDDNVDDAQIRRKLEEEMNYHLTGSRLDTSVSMSRIEQIRKERNKRVSNEPTFRSSHHSSTAPSLVPRMSMVGSSKDLYRSQDSVPQQAQYDVKASVMSLLPLSKPIKEETNYHNTGKLSSTEFPAEYRVPVQRTPAPDTKIGSSQSGQLKNWNPYLWTESRNQNEPGPRNGNFLLNPTTHFDYRQPGSLKYFSQDASPNILMSDAKGVQIGNNNTLYIGKRSYHRRKETMNTQNLEILNDNPVKESHLDLLRGELGKDWKHCARKLGFRESEIDEIDHDYERDGLKEKVFKMLYKWQMKEGLKGATVGKLVQALNSCNRSDLTLSLQNCL